MNRVMVVGLLAAAAVLVLIVMRFVAGSSAPDPTPAAPPLEDFGGLPEHTLVDQAGEAFSFVDPPGRVILVNTFFTTCITICPPLMAKMKGIQDQLTDRDGDERIVLASVTVDPENDTPGVLTRYQAENGVLPGRWYLLGGDRAVIRRLVVEGFQTAMGDREPTGPDGATDITHSAKLFLVDGRGRVRGYFSGTPEGATEALAAARTLLSEPGAAP